MERVQQSLFPYLDECLAVPLTEREKHLVKIFEMIQIEKYVPVTASRQWLGRPIKEREAIARAFGAKAVLKYQHTSSLRNELIGHVSRDFTAIVVREKPAKKVKPAKTPKKKGRPAKGEIREPAEPKRLDVQRSQSAEDALAQLPRVCDRGVKKNAKGYTETWNGFKLHLDVNDCGLPLSAVLTSASVHDSQVAIPLMKLTSSTVTSCSDIMDAAYDAAQIWDQSRELHGPWSRQRN